MAEIIDINFARQTQQEVFADDLKPMEEWTGEDWAWLIDECFDIMAQDTGKTKYDYFAEFMRTVLEECHE